MMRRFSVVLALGIGLTFAKITPARPVLLNGKQQIAMFPGSNRFTLAWTNQGSDRIDVEIKGRAFQETSALAIELPMEIKCRLQLLPNQAALMPVSANIPELRDKIVLLVRWEDGSQIIGKTEMTLYSRAFLHELELIAGDTGIGIGSTDQM